MKFKDIIEFLEIKNVTNCERIEDKDYNCVFAGDLMSDVLANVNGEGNNMILVTGLANSQTLRTAEMLDIDFIILVRNKTLNENDCNLAIENNISFVTTSKSMYETCGILYTKGLSSISI